MDDILSNDGRQYLSMLQGIIDRMGSNSANCKTLLFTMVAAMFALQVGSAELGKFIWVLIFPTVLFWWMDVRYLKLENEYRALESSYLKDPLGSNLLYVFDVAKIPDYKSRTFWKKASRSWATMWFYALCIVLIVFMCGLTSDWFQPIIDFFRHTCCRGCICN